MAMAPPTCDQAMTRLASRQGASDWRASTLAMHTPSPQARLDRGSAARPAVHATASAHAAGSDGDRERTIGGCYVARAMLASFHRRGPARDAHRDRTRRPTLLRRREPAVRARRAGAAREAHAAAPA